MMFFEQTETWEFAAEILEEYIDMDPYSVIAWSSLGHIHGENGDFEKAVWAYDYAITIEDDFGEAHLQKGFCLSELGKFKEAAVAFRAYIELDSPDAMAFTSIGDCFRAIDQFDEAESYYRSALQIDPKYTEAWFGLGMISAVKEKDEDAFKFFKKALEFGPENDYYLLQMIQVLMKMKYWSQAETFLLELVNKRRLHQSAWIWLAESQFEQNKVNEAIDTLAVWLDIDPEDDVALYYVSAYYFIQGDVKNANDYLCEALLLNPDNVQVLFDIAPFLKDVRQVNDVIDLYKNELS
jgi:tetratricopeptide (TPR) repeat protein